jgi:hypothetical protein
VLTLQGFRVAYAGITLPNEPSIRLHEALGFTSFAAFRGIGFKLGAWHDVAWMERELNPRTGVPAAPVPLPQLVGTERLEAVTASGMLRLRLPPQSS